MEDYTYTNWDKERDKIVDDVLEILRQQRDLEQEVTQSGVVAINPQIFAGAYKHLTFGPISFGSEYGKEPKMFFGQRPNINKTVFVAGKVTSYAPYLIQPYVYDFTWRVGAINGFYLGIYAPTTLPPASLIKTSIFWMAVGPASRYKKERLQESWTDPVDYNEPGFLMDNSE